MRPTTPSSDLVLVVCRCTVSQALHSSGLRWKGARPHRKSTFPTSGSRTDTGPVGRGTQHVRPPTSGTLKHVYTHDVHTHTHVHIHAHNHTHTLTPIPIRVHSCPRTRPNAPLTTHILTPPFAHSYPYLSQKAHSFKRTRAPSRTDTYTCVRTETRTLTYKRHRTQVHTDRYRTVLEGRSEGTKVTETATRP